MTEVNHAIAPDPLSRACLKCGKAFQVKFPSERKRYCSYSCSAKDRPPKAGAANPNWRGGKTAHPLYDIYLDMIGRCYRPTHQRYADYGGRGITVCERWRDDFWAFVADMGERPEGLTLDRENNGKGYSPDNCRWATYSEQVNNRRPLPSRFSDADRERMRVLYEDGLPLTKIAERFGTHSTYIGVILRDMGVQMRSSSPRKLSEEQCEEIRKLYGSGVRQHELASRYGIAKSGISRIVNEPRRQVA